MTAVFEIEDHIVAAYDRRGDRAVPELQGIVLAKVGDQIIAVGCGDLESLAVIRSVDGIVTCSTIDRYSRAGIDDVVASVGTGDLRFIGAVDCCCYAVDGQVFCFSVGSKANC